GHLLHPVGLRHRNERINEQLDSWPRLAWGTAGGASEDALKHNKALLVPDVDWARAARGREAALEWFKRFDLGSAVVAPMRAGGMQFGVAAVARSRSAVAYETGDVPYIQALADHVGLAVAMARMREELWHLGETREPE